jgi:hypothetical protein
MHNLTLVIPGLLGPDAHFSDDYIPALPALETLLSRARHTKSNFSSYHRTLSGLMGFDSEPEKDVPVAAITRAIDNDSDTHGRWLRADPVHLSPDRDGLILMDSFVLSLSQHDALAIADEVNKVLVEYGWTVEVPFEDRWYIRINDELDITTTELASVVGCDIAGYLPQGKDSARFHSLLNELQMQLHAADINQLREKNGELPINSVWFWGLGKIGVVPDPIWSAIFSDDIFTQSVAQMTSTNHYSVPQHLLGIQEKCGEKDDVLVVLPQCLSPTQYQNLQLWNKALLLLEGSWFEPAMNWLQQGKLNNLRIISDAHDFQLNRFAMKKFWRKSIAIGQYRNKP